MKKIIISFLTIAFIIGGAATYASAHTNGENSFDFDDMQPYMEEMHPDFSEEDQQAMYNYCHGDGGYMHNNYKDAK